MKKLKLGLVLITALIFSYSVQALASISLKDIKVLPNHEVELLFDGKVDKSQISVEYINDIIQINLNKVSVYPPKMKSFPHQEIKKVFAYQFSPKTVRCRFTVNGKAESFKNSFQFQISNADGKKLTVKLLKKPIEIPEGKPEALSAEEADEQELIQKVMHTAKVEATGAPLEASLEKVEHRKENEVAKETAPAKATSFIKKPLPVAEKPGLASGKPLPSMMGVFGKLMGVLALFLGFALVFKKYKSVSPAQAGKLLGFVKNLTPSQISNNDKMIEVLTRHRLDAKNSLLLARITGKVLVLGVSSDSIQLITRIDGDDPDLGDLGYAQETSPFAQVLGDESKASGMRSRIKNRLEGLKPL